MLILDCKQIELMPKKRLETSFFASLVANFFPTQLFNLEVLTNPREGTLDLLSCFAMLQKKFLRQIKKCSGS